MSQQPQNKKAASVLLHTKRCKNCGICLEFCPQGVFAWNAESAVEAAHPEKCNLCRQCEMRCPDFAIFVQEIA